MKNPFFNAHHAPMGALATLTLGCEGPKGGPALEKPSPANLDLFIGVEEKGANQFAFLPFMELKAPDLSDFGISEELTSDVGTRLFEEAEVKREFGLCNDRWSAGDMSINIISPVMSIPEPGESDPEDLKFALCPAILMELSIDNRKSDRARKAVFGYQRRADELYFNHVGHLHQGMTGIVQNRQIAIVTDDLDSQSAIGQDLVQMISPQMVEANYECALGTVGAVLVTVPPGEQKTVRFAVTFYREGKVTTGIDCEYLYTAYFKDVLEAAGYALDSFTRYAAKAVEAESMIEDARHLNETQKFMMRHAIRSYYGSTQLLRNCGNGEPIWVVNEGEYLMMNTFDLTVDQLFFELNMNPWTVRNVLDLFASRYVYHDEVFLPGEEKMYPGGISFTHDMGGGNCFTRPGWSSYERCGQEGCFSHMTYEQLCNFVLCAIVYVRQTNDLTWLSQNLPLLQDCFHSLVNRDHHDPAQRNGVMGMESSRVYPGSEITTYDSLDISLGQARANLYLAVKSWAAYLLLADIFDGQGLADLSRQARDQSLKCSWTISNNLNPQGFIPAVMEGDNESVIIPAVEGLVFPGLAGQEAALSPDGPYGHMIAALESHLKHALQPGVCIFEENGGYRISSTSPNSWLSKIYLNQHVIRKVFGISWDEQGKRSDEAHMEWLLDPESRYFAWSDQMIEFKAVGSKYYPRGVTSILWLDEVAD